MLVLGLSVGSLTFISIIKLIGRDSALEIDISSVPLLRTLGLEVTLAALLVPILKSRGWTLARVTHPPTSKDFLRGVAVWLLAMLAYLTTLFALYALAPSPTVKSWAFTGELSWGVVVLTALINPAFEEFLFLGYTVHALRPLFGLPSIFVASVALRTAVHLYQGPLAILAIAPLGAVFLAYYLKTHRLWPVILAHAIQDILSLGYIARTSAA